MVRRYHFDLLGHRHYLTFLIVIYTSLCRFLICLWTDFHLFILYSYCYSIGVLCGNCPERVREAQKRLRMSMMCEEIWHFKETLCMIGKEPGPTPGRVG